MIRAAFISIMMSFAVLGAPLPTVAHGAEVKTITLDVPGMTCKFCPITIRKSLEKIDGVVSAKADFDSKTATVNFDPDKTNIGALTQATANAGYPSSVKQ